MASTRNFIPMQQKYSRVVLLVDMDCFFCQVEEKLNPALKGQPVAVVQYNAWRGGGIIAVNYAARDKGVTRHMRGDEAKEKCPDIQLVKVPNIREKADLGKYREAGKEVANVLQRFAPLLERASVDEAYLDITEAVNKRLESMNAGSFVLQPQGLINTYVVGYGNIGEYVHVITARMTNAEAAGEYVNYAQAHDGDDSEAVRNSDIRLLIGASIAGEVRAAVKADTGYECSAGIAHNKILAKLAAGLNKPNKQTILPLAQIPGLFATLPVSKIRGLGGKFGEELCERLGVRNMGDLLNFTEADLQKKFDEKNGTWLYLMCRGIDLEAVTPRFYSKSIGCCKKFPGRNNITGLNTLKHWLNELAGEICYRLERDIMENNRRAKQMVVNYVQEIDGEEISSSRSAPLHSYDQEYLTKTSLEVLQANTKQFFRTGNTMALNNPIKFLGISVGKFETITSGQGKLQEMFANQMAKNKNKQEANEQPVREKLTIKTEPEDKNNDKERVAGKKKTLLETFLQSKKQATNIASNISDMPAEGTQTIRQESEAQANTNGNEAVDKINSDSIEEQKKKSFFFNAIKKQTVQISESYEPKISCSAVDKEDNAIEARANSFFAKVLPQIKRKRSEEGINDNTTTIQANSSEESQDNNFSAEQLEYELQLVESEPICDSADLAANDRCPEVTLTDVTTNEPSTSSSFNDYKTHYVEFAIPTLRPELLESIQCPDCGAKVPADEVAQQTHRDHHIALQLSQQQRVEYRAQLKNKTPPMPPNSAKKKLKVSSGPSAKVNDSKIDIKKFLKPAAEENTSTFEIIASPANSADLIKCSHCQVAVSADAYAEHQDFHVAKELQRELNQLEVRTVAVAKKTTGTSNARLQRSLNSSTTSVKNTKPITEFFSQPKC